MMKSLARAAALRVLLLAAAFCLPAIAVAPAPATAGDAPVVAAGATGSDDTRQTAGAGEEARQATDEAATRDFTTFFIVRHAEKAKDGTDDPPLTQEGEARSRAIAALLADAGVEALLSSPYQRAWQMLQPLADALGKQVTLVDAEDYDALIDEALKHDVVVIAGHSNTVPAIIEKLTGVKYKIADSEYDNLFIVTRHKSGDARVVRLHFDASAWK